VNLYFDSNICDLIVKRNKRKVYVSLEGT